MVTSFHILEIFQLMVARKLPHFPMYEIHPNPFKTIYLSIYLSIYSCCSNLEHKASVKHFVSLQFLNFRQSVGLLGWEISLTQGRYLHRMTQTQNKRKQTSMPSVGFEPTNPMSERTKTFHALDRAATVIGIISNTLPKVTLRLIFLPSSVFISNIMTYFKQGGF
jgi:hypothetical protein